MIAWQEEAAELEADILRALPPSRSPGSPGPIDSWTSETPIFSPRGAVHISNRRLNEAKQDRNGGKASTTARGATQSTDHIAKADLVLADGTLVIADDLGGPRFASAPPAPTFAHSAENSNVARRTLMCLEKVLAKPGVPLKALQRAAGFADMQKLINGYAPDLDATELRRLFDECDTDQVIMEESVMAIRLSLPPSCNCALSPARMLMACW